MDEVQAQYEAFPYPERDPADEADRLIEGSPSDPAEIDHYIYGGQRDWSQPFRVLFAGGGTGDGLIMLASKFQAKGHPVEIVYLDLSEASLEIAKARAEARGIDFISFHRDSLLNATDYGAFDYIDCCGVLHHLEDPLVGLRALASALKPDGGLGAMVYAPLGRRGVYALQTAFQTLLSGRPVSEQLKPARAVLEHLNTAHPFLANPNVSDHKVSDAGFVDLLLHSQDKPFQVEELFELADAADMRLVSLIEARLYDPAIYLPSDKDIRQRAAKLSTSQQAALAENLNGNMKTHIFYLAHKANDMKLPSASSLKLVPRLRGVSAAALAKQVAKEGRLKVTLGGMGMTLPVSNASSNLIAQCDGKSLSEIATALRLSMLDFIKAWTPVHNALTGVNLLRYSNGFD
ncbi:MAG: methyltransferase [Ponticaulis sp.]|nr:methyltransferase [Ponticaulis sp.]|tara:strand:+ start:18602 stop:19813 length:1212 start_codon:yes stop_codon:yes gene_type:complete